MDLRQIKNIMKEFEESSIHKLEISDSEFTIKLEKENNNTFSSLPSIPNGVERVISAPMKEEVVALESNDNIEVKAPLVGTYYESPSPDSSPFVSKNDFVKKGDTLFIIEAMKVMNEVKAPCDGYIVEINLTNGTMVEFGQTIMEIKE